MSKILNKIKFLNSKFDNHLAEYDFTIRTYNILSRYTNCKNLEDIAKYSSEDLLQLQHLGKKSLKEIRDKLNQYGLTLKNDDKYLFEVRIIDIPRENKPKTIYDVPLEERSHVHTICNSYDEAQNIVSTICKENNCCIREIKKITLEDINHYKLDCSTSVPVEKIYNLKNIIASMIFTNESRRIINDVNDNLEYSIELQHDDETIIIKGADTDESKYL